MREFTNLAFDEYITVVTSYTAAPLNDRLGSADELILHAVTTQVSGTSPTLTCQVETSGDGRHWTPAGTAEINGLAIVEGSSSFGNRAAFNPPLLNFVRIKITLGGTSPACRLCLYVTGRVSRWSRNGAGASPRAAAKGMPPTPNGSAAPMR